MKSKKVVKIVTIVIMLLLILNTMSFAKIETEVYKPSELTTADYDEAFKLGGILVSGLQIVGTVIAIAGIMIMGVKYMIGSIEQKAQYKKTLIPYIIGCIFIFTISNIVSLIYNLATQL